jgi:hypothetical protein
VWVHERFGISEAGADLTPAQPEGPEPAQETTEHNGRPVQVSVTRDG